MPRKLLVLLSVLVVATLPTSAAQETTAPAPDPRRTIERHLTLGKWFLQSGEYTAAQDEFRAILKIDATHPEALRLMTKAQQLLQATRTTAARSSDRLKAAANRLALEIVREKTAQAQVTERHAAQQLIEAREQQLKLLYTKGLSRYRQGKFQDAIDTFQQMVLIAPDHPLVRAAGRLIIQAEAKLAEARAVARARARITSGAPPARIPELEQQLTAKRIEQETLFKYAQLAMKDRRHQQATQLLQRMLAQDPEHRQAQELLHAAHLALLDDEEARYRHQVERDEQTMMNDVVKAQILPETRTVQLTPPAGPSAAANAMSAKLQQPISLDFQDVALSDVLQFVADAANVSIIPSPQLDLKTRTVSLKVHELPLDLALKYLTKRQELAYRVEEDAILIATPEEFDNEPLETRVFFLRNGLGPFALQTTTVESNPSLPLESMKELIEQTVPQPPEAKLVVDERTGSLVVTNTTDNLLKIEQLLSQLDVTPLQVLIEARFIELTMTDLEHVGLESVLTGAYNLSKEKRGNGSFDPGHQIAKGGGFKFPSVSRESEGVNLTLETVLTGLQLETVLHLLEESKKSKTLSAPRVTTLNNQTATIRVVDEFNYPTRYEVSLIQFDINGDGDFDDAGETEFANVPQDLQKRDVGILLYVTPSVGKDLRTVTLVLAPEVSQFSQFRDLGGGVTVPEFTTSQLTTSVMIEDGQTVVLGGLMKDTVSETVQKVPVLGDLPFVGGLFRQKEATDTRKNLLIFITARVLAPRGQTT